MRQILIFIFICFGFIYGEDKVDITDFSMSSSFSDFNDIDFDVEGVFAKNQTVQVKADLNYDVEFDNGSYWEDVHYEDDFYEPTVPIYLELEFDLTEQVFNIAYKGNGDYRIKILGYGDEDSDETGWHYFSVTDVVAPSVPASVSTSWSSNHPHLSWNDNSEIDLQYYEIWKKRNEGVWSLKATTTNSYYTDGSEVKYSPPATKEDVYYKICAVDYEDNASSFTSSYKFVVNQYVENVIAFDISQQAKLANYSLSPNYPNPFNPVTKISFGLPELSDVSLKVYDLTGKEIATLAEGTKEEGYYDASFDGSNLTSGVYIYRFSARGFESGKTFNQVKRMLLIK